MDFACGSGSLLLNVRKRMKSGDIGKIYGQEESTNRRERAVPVRNPTRIRTFPGMPSLVGCSAIGRAYLKS